MKFRLEEIEVPEDEPFKNDALQRQPVVEFVRDLIKQLDGPFVLALDSPWGTGKTTVVRMLRASLKKEGFTSVYFNAWKEDYVSDPLIPMVAAIDGLQVADAKAEKQFGERMATVKRVASKVAKRGLVAAVKLATMNAVDLDEVTEETLSTAAGDAADDVIESFKQEKASLERFRTALEDAVKTVQPEDVSRPLVFFIDELDRCRPTFAIELLERVKHLFDVKHIVFVLSIDKNQLKAITAAVYGDRIDAHEYLRRFLDLELVLPSLYSSAFTGLQLQKFGFKKFFEDRKKHRELAYDWDHFVETFTVLSKVFSLTVRARERCLTRLALVAIQTPVNHFLDPVIVAFLLVLRDVRGDLYQGLITGSSSPQEVMTAVRSLSTGRELTVSRFASVIEAYLVVGDVDRERGARVWEELTKLAEDKTPTAEAIRAREVVEKRRFIDGQWGRSFSLLSVVNKIDLASIVD